MSQVNVLDEGKQLLYIPQRDILVPFYIISILQEKKINASYFNVKSVAQL